MSQRRKDPAAGPSRVEVEAIERVFEGFFSLDRATVRHERFDGRMSGPATILNFDRGDAVAVLLHDPKTDAVCLTRQFRYPAWVHDGPGWILDVAAGILEPGETPESTARREVTEETGLDVTSLEPIVTFYPSPGGCSERVVLYLGRVDLASRLTAGGPAVWRGGVDEHEDIEVIAIPRRTAMEWLDAGRFVEPKTIMALLWLERRIGPPRERA
jgi:ADP-ribose pyrophosphatase